MVGQPRLYDMSSLLGVLEMKGLHTKHCSGIALCMMITPFSHCFGPPSFG
jgi:hypothetical protein